MFRARGWRAFAAVLAMLFLAACAQKMADQPKVKPLTGSDFFGDGQSSRPLPPDTVSQSDAPDDELLTTGMVNGKPADLFPFPITRDILLRGQQLFNAYCSVCHDRTGSANGMVVQKGYASPPVLYIDRLVQEPAGYFFDVITNGFSATDLMPSYGSQIQIKDRWAIIAYIRALQLSENAKIDDVPPDIRPTLEAQP